MEILIKKAKDGVYDVWNYGKREWLFSTLAPDNLFNRLADLKVPFTIKFIDAEIEEILAKNKK